MININKKTIIYILAPANNATGGPEALHQLGKELIQMGFKTMMYYIPNDTLEPIHFEYKHYSIPYSNGIEDDENNIIITPEQYNYIKILGKFNKIQKVIWWLSVDNFYISYFFNNHKILGTLIKIINKFAKKIGYPEIIDLPKTALKTKIDWTFTKNVKINLVQSNYAKYHLESKGIKNIEPLFEYIKNCELLSSDGFVKQDIILFNPTKGINFTQKIISSDNNLNFTPIKNMSHEEVINLMKKSKLYIDFGNHPGRDRMPREAVLCGCSIITGKKGSAFYNNDVNIPPKYKFEDKEKNIPIIIETIKEIINNFDSTSKDFDNYRNLIKNEHDVFKNQLSSIFYKNQ